MDWKGTSSLFETAIIIDRCVEWFSTLQMYRVILFTFVIWWRNNLRYCSRRSCFVLNFTSSMHHPACTDDPKRCIVTFVLLLLWSRVIKYALILWNSHMWLDPCPDVCGNVTMNIPCEDMHILALLIFDSITVTWILECLDIVAQEDTKKW